MISHWVEGNTHSLPSSKAGHVRHAGCRAHANVEDAVGKEVQTRTLGTLHAAGWRVQSASDSVLISTQRDWLVKCLL